MPTELTARMPMPVAPSLPLEARRAAIVLRDLLVVALLAGLLVGVQCQLGGCPSEALLTVAGP